MSKETAHKGLIQNLRSNTEFWDALRNNAEFKKYIDILNVVEPGMRSHTPNLHSRIDVEKDDKYANADLDNAIDSNTPQLRNVKYDVIQSIYNSMYLYSVDTEKLHNMIVKKDKTIASQQQDIKDLNKEIRLLKAAKAQMAKM